MSYTRENPGRLQVYTNNNVTTTPIAVVNTYYPILFTSTPAIYNYNFTVATNSYTYLGTTNQFKISITGNMNKLVASNIQCAVSIFKNGVQIADSEVNFFVNQSEQHIFSTQCFTSLTNGDIITMMIKNITNTDTLVVSSMNLIIE